MTTGSSDIKLTDIGKDVLQVSQRLFPSEIPFTIPVLTPIANPFSRKQMRFRKRYKITGISIDEAVTGVLFSNYRPFMDIKEETYSRASRTRQLVFNPFTVELEKTGQRAGDLGARAGRGAAALVGAGLGLIEWHIHIETSTPDSVSLHFKTQSKLFSGHFKINADRVAGGVVLEDDWTPEGGAEMLSDYLAMANLVLLTHPKGFHQIAENLVDEIKRARECGKEYVGEIGSPSNEKS